jgi:hypothetical protein
VRGVYLFRFSRINTYFTRFSGGRHISLLEWFDFGVFCFLITYLFY